MPRVLICDDDVDLVEVMGEFLRDSGIDCVTTHSFDEVRAHRDEALACSMAFLDVNLGAGRPSGVDVFRWLQQQRFGGTVVFLTGHATGDPELAGTQTLGMPVLAKPLGPDVLLELARAKRSA